MSDRDAIGEALRDGVITADQAEKLQGYLSRGGDPYGAQDPENLSFLSSFNDIFLTIGILILLTGSSIFAGWMAANVVPLTWVGPTTSIIVAAFTWALSEYFCLRRRLLLPSMALATAFYILAGIGVGSFMAKIAAETALDAVQAGASQMGHFFNTGYWGATAGALAAIVYYFRFRLPFSLFLVAVSGSILTYSFIFENSGFASIGGLAIFLVGAATLVCAMVFDARDPTRSTRQSDNAFWLHLAAAPQIMLGLRFMIIGENAMSDLGSSVIMLAVLLVVGFLSLALNRRALIFSGLVTFTLVVFSLVNNSGLSGAEKAAVPLLIVGASVVLLGAGWRTARSFALKFVPETGVWARLFPPENVLKGDS